MQRIWYQATKSPTYQASQGLKSMHRLKKRALPAYTLSQLTNLTMQRNLVPNNKVTHIPGESRLEKHASPEEAFVASLHFIPVCYRPCSATWYQTTKSPTYQANQDLKNMHRVKKRALPACSSSQIAADHAAQLGTSQTTTSFTYWMN